MKTWTSAILCLVTLNACAVGPYREEFNFTAPFAAYSHFKIVSDHPFDAENVDDAALEAELANALTGEGLAAASAETLRESQLAFVFNHDIAAGRLRILTLAANSVATWQYQLKKDATSEELIGLEAYEVRSGEMLWRVEAQRGETDAETIENLLRRYPPKRPRRLQ